MKVCAPLVVSLVGGPHDGECIIMSPAPGVGPPQRLTYCTGDFQVQDVYEIWPPIAVWPDESEGVAVSMQHDPITLNINAVKVTANHVGKMRMTMVGAKS